MVLIKEYAWFAMMHIMFVEEGVTIATSYNSRSNHAGLADSANVVRQFSSIFYYFYFKQS